MKTEPHQDEAPMQFDSLGHLHCECGSYMVITKGTIEPERAVLDALCEAGCTGQVIVRFGKPSKNHFFKWPAQIINEQQTTI